jgi:hypothetical protein
VADDSVEVCGVEEYVGGDWIAPGALGAGTGDFDGEVVLVGVAGDGGDFLRFIWGEETFGPKVFPSKHFVPDLGTVSVRTGPQGISIEKRYKLKYLKCNVLPRCLSCKKVMQGQARTPRS